MRNVNKYGKLLLSAYIMKKMKSGRTPGTRGLAHKYIKLAIGAYLLNKLKSGRLEKEIEAEVEPEEEAISEAEGVETGKKGSSMRIGKIILGGLAGATLLYAVKRRAAKKREHRIEVE